MSLPTRAERRRHPRKTVNREVRIFRHNGSDPGGTVLVRDISLRGMAIQATGLSLVVGDALLVCLSGEQGSCGPEHVIETTVVNLRDGIAGLQFECVGIYVLKDIQRLLRGERAF